MNKVERLRLAQEGKRKLVEEGEVCLPKSIAALALGLSLDRLEEIEQSGRVLIIRPSSENVFFSLEQSVRGWRKDLWRELVDSLAEGRSRASQIEEAYRFLYPLTQAVLSSKAKSFAESTSVPRFLTKSEEFLTFWAELEMGKADLEGNEEFLQVLLFSLWGGLGEEKRKELFHMSPSRVRDSMGIVG